MKRSPLFFTLFLLIILTISCSRSETYNQPVAYNHKLHVEEADLGCLDCHKGVLTHQKATIPNIDVCIECHEEAMSDSKEEEKVVNYISENRQIPWVQVNGQGAPRLANTLNISCHYIEGEAMLYQLSAQGICASSGSACTSGSLEPSHVLKAMNVPFTAMHGSVRFSLSRYNSEEDVDRIIEVFPEVVRNLRRLSPYWDNKNDRPRAE